MGRRLKTSQPTVIQTQLTPLSDTFSIQASDTLEQWFYVNTGEYSPDRTQTPLQLTPTIEAVDEDSSTKYTPSFLNVSWYYFDPNNTTDYSSDTYWPGLGWVKITAVEGGTGVDYYCPTQSNPKFKLYVTKNVAPPSVGSTTAGQGICCVASYIDPRDVGVTYVVKDNVTLVTSKEASVNTVAINLLAPTKTIFNILEPPTEEIDNQTVEITTFDFKAQILDSSNNDVTSSYYIEWYGKENNEITEHLINTLNCYTQTTQKSGKGQGTDTITIDAMYTEHIDIVCKIRRTSTSALLPAISYCSLVWDVPRVDVMTICRNGQSVDSTNREMNFTNIVNYKGGVLSDEKRKENLRFHFYSRVSTSSVLTDRGWGDEITIDSSQLKQTTSYATPVHAEVYLTGAFENVTHNGENVTHNGQYVFHRFIN